MNVILRPYWILATYFHQRNVDGRDHTTGDVERKWNNERRQVNGSGKIRRQNNDISKTRSAKTWAVRYVSERGIFTNE